MVSENIFGSPNGSSGDVLVSGTGSEIGTRVSGFSTSTPHAIHGQFPLRLPPLSPHLRHAQFSTQETHIC